jgi:endonuclease III
MIEGDVPKLQLLDFHHRVLAFGRRICKTFYVQLREITCSARQRWGARACLVGSKPLLWFGIDVES